MASNSSTEIFCYFHIGGKFVKDVNGRMQYDGGRSNGRMIKEGMSLQELTRLITSCMNYDISGAEVKYTLKFDSTTFLDLVDDEGVGQIIKLNDQCAHVYIVGNENQSRDTPMESSQGMVSLSGPLRSRRQSVHVPMLELNGAEWKDLFLGSGQMFPNAVAFRQALYKYSIAHKFSYIFVKNSAQKMIVKCNIDGCKWKLTAYAVGKTTPFLRVTSFHNEHLHSAEGNPMDRRRGRSTLTSSVIIEGLRSSVDKAPNEIRSDLYREYGINLSYRQALRGKERALEDLHGPLEQSYMLIPWLCNKLVETDPGTIAKWVASENNRFERLFIAYGCCINGFILGARPILYVNGWYLSGPYSGTLLAASALDADNELFPIAYAIVSAETFDEWTWFLQNMKEITGSVPITIVSDRNNAIIGAMKATFGGERHAYCYRHIKEIFSSEFSKICKGMRSSKDDALRLLDAIAYARVECDFVRAMVNLRTFSPELAQWVVNDGDVERWALSRFPYRRWDTITTNLADSFNIWLVKERRHNVCALINEHRDKLTKKLYASKEAIRKWTNGVGPNVMAVLKENILRAEIMRTEHYGANRILVHSGSVDFMVNLTLRECICQAWQMCGIPCPHACAAIKLIYGNVYNYVEDCYLVGSQEKIYSSIMMPVETNDMPKLDALTVNDYMTQTFLHPPMTSRPRGRPPCKQRESQSQSQNKKAYHCSLCQQAGHTRKKCTNPS